MPIKAVIFDLDGVVVSTDEFHYLAWQRLADEQGIYFDRDINQRLRGVSRMQSLEILLERAEKCFSTAEKEALAAAKNACYLELLERLTPEAILPGFRDFAEQLRALGIRLAVGSSSKNSPAILRRIGLETYFDATADGNDITRSKPDPEVFLLAAERVGVSPAECLVVEDADAGVEAALAAGMKVLALGSACQNNQAHWRFPDLARADLKLILEQLR